MYFSHTFVPSPGTTPKADDFCIQSPTTFVFKSDDFPDVDSPKVVDIPSPLPLIPEQHRTSLAHIGTCPRDTTAPSAITWMAINERLGTGRLGTVILVFHL
jgi:hypothetical protein